MNLVYATQTRRLLSLCRNYTNKFFKEGGPLVEDDKIDVGNGDLRWDWIFNTVVVVKMLSISHTERRGLRYISLCMTCYLSFSLIVITEHRFLNRI